MIKTSGPRWRTAATSSTRCCARSCRACPGAPAQATFLAWLDYAALGLGTGARDLFPDRGRVALEDGGESGAAGRHHVRLNLAASGSILAEAAGRMASARR